KILAEAFTRLVLCHRAFPCLTIEAVIGLSGSQTVIDVSLTANLTEPVFEGRPSLAFEQHLAGTHPLELIFHVASATVFYLDQVPAKLCQHRLAEFARLQGIHGLLERWHRFARRQPAQVTPLWRRGIIGITARNFGKVFARGDTLTQVAQACQGT